MVWAAKAFLKHQGKPLQSFVVEVYKRKGKSKALVINLEKMGTKKAFKSKEMVESDSDKGEEERVCVIKKIKWKHIEDLTGAHKEKGIAEFQAIPSLLVLLPAL
ncbi:hypothetical protein C0995_001174 [Termitomyces sp. Mi166|nr:hypothetical protein C0995_001174 [Termitomyces sp. Mi166\